jgi:acyl carrier protein
MARGLTGLVRAALSSVMSDEIEAALKREIKEAMVEELMLQQPAEQIADDAALFAPTGLGLDSVDALQLVVALEKRYGLKISDAEAAKGILRDVNTITAAVLAHRAATA